MDQVEVYVVELKLLQRLFGSSDGLLSTCVSNECGGTRMCELNGQFGWLPGYACVQEAGVGRGCVGLLC